MKDRERKQNQVYPFTIDLTKRPPSTSTGSDSDSPFNSNPDCAPLFPSTYRTPQGNLHLVESNISDFLASELNVTKLDSIYNHLWLAGLPVPPRPLHYQVVLGREIVVCERMDMHLVWGKGRMYLKPIPRFLLSPGFWGEYLSCVEGCVCFRTVGRGQCAAKIQRSIAFGFLFTYASLLSSETDFLLAQELGLVPHELTSSTSNTTKNHWADWCTLVEQLLTHHTITSFPSSSTNIYTHIHRRFQYSELRLSRLNTITLLTSRTLTPFLNPYPSYTDFLRDQLAWLAAATIYIVLVLAAMQVGLATNRLQGNEVYMSAAYGFSIFAILGPLVGGFFVVGSLAVVVVVNWAWQRGRARGRFRVMSGELGWEGE
ncbi:hypothetical protein BDV06DRAFT_221709 [Aspergillus oleicola]